MAIKAPTATGIQRLKAYLKTRKVDNAVLLCITLLQVGAISTPYDCAVATTRLLGSLISNFNEKLPVLKLTEQVTDVGRRLERAKPNELVIGNMVRRVLGLIKECALGDEEEQTFDVAAHMSTLLQAETVSKSSRDTSIIVFDTLPSAPSGPDKKVAKEKLVSAVILDVVSGIQEIMDELESTAELVDDFASQYISSTDKVLIQAYSPLSHSFLAAAARTSPGFTVFAISDSRQNLPETIQLSTTGKSTVDGAAAANQDDGDADEAKPLSKLGISVIVLPETDVFSIMPKITKVVIAPDAVLPDGSIISTAGTSSVVLAARTFNVPTLSVSGTYHFCPVPLQSPPPVFVGNTGYALGRAEEEDDDEDSDEEEQEETVVKTRAPLRGAYYEREIVRDGIELFISNVGVCGKTALPRIMDDQYDKEYLTF